jgi:predicted component of type VI protein secretion system
MTKPLPRSRLNITYRTKIEGTPKKVKLPMRFLVLGDFTGANDSPLEERRVQSIMPGMQLKSFMYDLNVTAPIEHAKLKQSFAGALTGHITARFKKQPEDKATAADLLVTGTGIVRGSRKDNGLGDFEGKVVISGEIKAAPLKDGVPTVTTATLKITGKVRGDVDKGGVTGTVTSTVPVAVTLAARVNNDNIELALDNDVSGDVKVDLTIPLFDPVHFKPVHIAASVPETRRLVTLRRILLELRGYISGQPELRDALKELLKTRMADMTALQTYFKARYRQLIIEPPAGAPAAPPALSDSARSLVEALLTASGMSAGNWKQLALVSTADEVAAPAAATTPAATTPAATTPPAATTTPAATTPAATTPAAKPAGTALVNLKFRDQDEDFPT